MPTKRRRHAITETPPVEAALNALRQESGQGRLDLSELVVLGAEAKLAELQASGEAAAIARRQLADRIRHREVMGDIEAADEVRATGWIHT